MNSRKPNRREFLGRAGLGIAASTVGVPLLGQAGSAPPPAAAAGEMPYRTLGRSGEKVSLVGLGGYHIGLQQDEAESIRIIRTAVDEGINFLDNCWDYNHGKSEVRMGKAFREGYRKKVFLMTMKSMGEGVILRSNTVTPVECLHYAMNLPTSVVITGCDSLQILEQALEAARTFRPLSESEVAAILARTAPVAAKGEFEPFKTSNQFDGTAHNPEWLG
jgi:hypothetical protein